MRLVVQFFDRHLCDGNPSMSERVDELGTTGAGDSAAFDCDSSPCEYHSKAAATRISLTNSSGDNRSAESAASDTSKVMVGIRLVS